MLFKEFELITLTNAGNWIDCSSQSPENGLCGGREGLGAWCVNGCPAAPQMHQGTVDGLRDLNDVGWDDSQFLGEWWVCGRRMVVCCLRFALEQEIDDTY